MNIDSTVAAVQHRSASGRCVAIENCPLRPEYRLMLTVGAFGDLPRNIPRLLSFSTPHKVCEMHNLRGNGAPIPAESIAGPAERAMVEQYARDEAPWADSIEVEVFVTVRLA